MKRLIDQNCSESESEVALNRTEMYANYNQEHPGFFDAVISSEDLDKGYENLKNLVLSYLGVSNLESKDSIDQSVFNQNQLSIVQSSRFKKSAELKEQMNEMPRTGKLSKISIFLIYYSKIHFCHQIQQLEIEARCLI